MTELTPFERNIAEQPEALRVLAAASVDPALAEIAARPWERIVVTGMGSSHFAGIPTWRRLVADGRPAWMVDASTLLDAPGLLNRETLVIATSQSGASGEVVELLARARAGQVGWGALIGVAADENSPLAAGSDLFLPLLSGDEATVSTKSYLNSLAVHRRIVTAFTGSPTDDIAQVADLIMPLVTLNTTAIAQAALEPPRPRLAAIGWDDAAGTALYAALITKESSKVAIEGFSGGAFRHGPLELAGPGLTAIIFLSSDAQDSPSARIAGELVATGARVVLVGQLELRGATTLPSETGESLAAMASQSVVAESLAVALSRANGVTPGEFAFGSKVTVST